MKKFLLLLVVLFLAFSIVVYEKNKAETPQFLSLDNVGNITLASGHVINSGWVSLKNLRITISETVDAYKTELDQKQGETEETNVISYFWYIAVAIVNFIFSNIFSFLLLCAAILYILWKYLLKRNDEPYYEEDDE